MHKHIPSSRLGHWLPVDRSILNNWLQKTIEAATKAGKAFHPVITEFQKLIETDPVFYMYFIQMFQQQPHIPIQRGSGDVKIKDYHQMLRIINYVLTTAPEFNNTEMVGFPINAILDYPMYTSAGQAAFLNSKVNAMLKKILRVWTDFLNSDKSCYVLNENANGWFSPEAQKALNIDEFILDKSKPYWGFTSWNDFFIRQFKPGMRPLPADNEKIIVSACESQPFAIDTNVKKTDAFWLKGQSYSLQHILNEKHVDYFVGGTVYQAFLSAEKYHRWHSPVDGVVKEIEIVEGSYYAEAYAVGFDPVGPNNSQGYIAHVATRALIFIESNNKNLGMICVIPIGMAEVSSCIVTVKANQQVKKGDQLGYFQFGGSTHCLVFKKDAIAQFASNAIPQGDFGANSNVVKINSAIATTN
jgi:phosphatidylserine decarboxylase